MADDTIKQISQLLDSKIKPLHGEIAKIHHDLSDLRSSYLQNSVGIKNIRNDTARIDSELENIRGSLENPDIGLKTINEKLDLQAEMLDNHTETLNDMAVKVEKRLGSLEDGADIKVSPKLQLVDIA